MATETVTIGAEGLTVSLVVWRRFHRPMPGLVARILALNPGLAALGPVLPLGAVLRLPVDAPRRADPPATVRLW